MLLLVRHAHAGSKSRWRGPDGIRPLSPAGRAQADGLVVRLEDYPIRGILSSPAVRCRQTVRPLAHHRALPVEPTPLLAVDADLALVLALLEDSVVRDAVLCTHGEVIGQVLARLAAGQPPSGEPPAWPKGSTWVLDRVQGRLTAAGYLPPLVLRATAASGSALPAP